MQSVLAIIFFVALVVFPIISAMRFTDNFERLSTKEMVIKYYSYFTDLDITASARVVWFPVYFMARRIMLGLTIVLLDQSVIWQVSGKITLVLIALNLVGQIKPFRDPFRNRMEQFNETLMMFVVYHTICFTPWLQNNRAYFILGYSVVFIVVLHLFVNFYFIAKD